MQSIDAAGIDSSCKGKSELPVKAQYWSALRNPKLKSEKEKQMDLPIWNPRKLYYMCMCAQEEKVHTSACSRV